MGNSHKRGHAVNGDLFDLRHPQPFFDAPFTSFIDVSFRGTTYQVLTAAERNAFSYATVTGEFSVGGLAGHVIETLDNVAGKALHRYQGVVVTPDGALSTQTHDSPAGLLALIGALRPLPTRLGVTIDPDDEVEVASAPKVALQLDVGLVEITPLTGEVIEQLPAWSGSVVRGGELYGGRLTDETPYLTLVTSTCRVVIMPGAPAHADRAADFAAELLADWKA